MPAVEIFKCGGHRGCSRVVSGFITAWFHFKGWGECGKLGHSNKGFETRSWSQLPFIALQGRFLLLAIIISNLPWHQNWNFCSSSQESGMWNIFIADSLKWLQRPPSMLRPRVLISSRLPMTQLLGLWTTLCGDKGSEILLGTVLHAHVLSWEHPELKETQVSC